MKNILSLVVIAAVLATAGCATQSRGTDSNIVVLPLGGEVQVTDGSIVYALPMTVFEFDIVAERTIEVPGPYAAYAGEMLGLDNVIVSETEIWSLAGMQLSTVEELDPGQFYVIQGSTLMQTNLLAMKKSGLVLDINPDVYAQSGYSQLQGGGLWSGLLFPDRGAYEYVSTRTDTAYKVVKADTAFIRVPYLVQRKKGMTVAEEAREAADRLLELREGRHMILTGETNIFPQDGSAIEEINRLEREYTALFAGKQWTETKHYKIWFTPLLPMAGTKTPVFSFSEVDGVLPAGSSRGKTVSVEMLPSGKTSELKLIVRPVASEKELAARDRLYYRVPDVVDVRISSGDEILCTARKLIYQFGTTVALPSNFIIGK